MKVKDFKDTKKRMKSSDRAHPRGQGKKNRVNDGQPHPGNRQDNSKGPLKRQPAKSVSKGNRQNKKVIAVRILSFFVLVAAVFTSVFSLCLYFTGTHISSAKKEFMAMTSVSEKGKGYPFEFEQTGSSSARMLGSCLGLLDSDSLTILNSTAKEITSLRHSYANAQMEGCKKKAVIFDRGGRVLEVVGFSGSLMKITTDNDIFTVSVGERGQVGVATKSDTAQSEFVVYEKDGNEMFRWECASERISSVAISDNGKFAAVCVIGSEDAQLYSKLHIFDFKKDSPIVSYTYPETALLKTTFGSEGYVLTVGNNLFSTVNFKRGEKKDYPFGSGELAGFNFAEDGKTALVVSAFGDSNNAELLVYSHKAKLLYKEKLEAEVRFVGCDETYTSILTQDNVLSFNNKGKLVGKTKAEKYSEKTIAAGKNIYLIEKGLVQRFSAISDID